MGALFELEHDDVSLKIYTDEDPMSPRDWDTLSTMICFHKRYTLGDDHNYVCNDYSDWEELRKAIEKDNNVAIIFPLYMYDHSGITISTSLEYPYNDRWDAGQIGWVFVTKEQIRKEYSVKRITLKIIERAKKCIISEVNVYDEYLRGDVYGFVLEKNITCSKCEHIHTEHIDSCFGFYGDLKESGMIENIPDEFIEIRKQFEERF